MKNGCAAALVSSLLNGVRGEKTGPALRKGVKLTTSGSGPSGERYQRQKVADQARRDRDTRRRKRIWRKTLLAGRKARFATNRPAQHQNGLTTGLSDLIGARIRPGDVVATHVPFGAEPDVAPFTEMLLDKGAVVLVPDLSIPPDGPRMPFRRVDRGTADGGHLSEKDVKVVIVPALALDNRGMRLGRGAGWYDRALRRFSGENTGAAEGPMLVGVCYDDEFLKDSVLPAESHDLPLDYVVTETQTVKLQG